MKILWDIQKEYRETELRVCAHAMTGEVIALKALLDELLQQKLTVYREQESVFVDTYAIVRIYTGNKRVYVRTGDAVYEVRDRLYALEETLRDKGFVRISNTELVNTAHIRKLDMSYAGTIKMFFTNGDETYVSRRYVRKIKAALAGEATR